MNDKIKRVLAGVAALAALGLGGAAIAGATGGGSSDQATAENEQTDGSEVNEAAEAPGTEQADGSEANEAADVPDQPGDSEESGAGETSADDAGGDGDGELAAADEQRARAAAESASGGSADGDVEPAEQADPVEDAGDRPTPKGAVYEVEVTKGDQALKVFLDASFHAIDTVPDAG